MKKAWTAPTVCEIPIKATEKILECLPEGKFHCFEWGSTPTGS